MLPMGYAYISLLVAVLFSLLNKKQNKGIMLTNQGHSTCVLKGILNKMRYCYGKSRNGSFS